MSLCILRERKGRYLIFTLARFHIIDVDFAVVIATSSKNVVTKRHTADIVRKHVTWNGLNEFERPAIKHLETTLRFTVHDYPHVVHLLRPEKGQFLLKLLNEK